MRLLTTTTVLTFSCQLAGLGLVAAQYVSFLVAVVSALA